MAGTNGKHPTPILDLDDLIEPGATWTYQGATYQYVRWSSLGLLERRRITNKSTRINALEETENPSDEEATEYEATVRDLLALISDAPAAVIDGMNSEQRSEVVTYFLALRLVRISDLREKRQQSAATWITPPQTTETSSPDSTNDGPRRTRKHGS